MTNTEILALANQYGAVSSSTDEHDGEVTNMCDFNEEQLVEFVNTIVKHTLKRSSNSFHAIIRGMLNVEDKQKQLIESLRQEIAVLREHYETGTSCE